MILLETDTTNLFVSTDHSFCDNSTCSRREECVRHNSHYDFEGSNYISYLYIPEPSKCQEFIKIKKRFK